VDCIGEYVSLLALCIAPHLFHLLRTDWRDLLYYQVFKIGALAITPVFLLKAVGFLILLIFLSKLLQRFVLTHLLSRLSISAALKFAIERFATYLFFLAGLFIGLQSLGVNLDSLVIFGGAVGVGVGLGLQNVVSNFVAGLILLIEQPIRIGDRVEATGVLGDVIKIGARSTWVRTNDNVIIIVPNSRFIENPVTNWTANDPNVRIALTVGVGYNSDPELVRRLLLQAAADHPKVLKEPAPDVIFTEYGDSTINFDLRVWTAELAHIPVVLKSDLYFALFKTFAEQGIELPFPQRDLHIRSSDVPLPYPGPERATDSKP
jgi:small-conductance mechanosensitive channel